MKEEISEYYKQKGHERLYVVTNANCICYTFSAIVIKFIAETDLWVAITVQASTNFIGCYLAMWFCEWWLNARNTEEL